MKPSEFSTEGAYLFHVFAGRYISAVKARRVMEGVKVEKAYGELLSWIDAWGDACSRLFRGRSSPEREADFEALLVLARNEASRSRVRAEWEEGERVRRLYSSSAGGWKGPREEDPIVLSGARWAEVEVGEVFEALREVAGINEFLHRDAVKAVWQMTGHGEGILEIDEG